MASDDAPEVETTVTVVDENKPETSDDTESADTAEPTESDEPVEQAEQVDSADSVNSAGSVEPVEQMDETVVEPTAETTGQNGKQIDGRTNRRKPSNRSRIGGNRTGGG